MSFLIQILALNFLFVQTTLFAQNKLNDESKKEIIDAINYQLLENYVFPSTAEQMGNQLISNLNIGKYNKIKDKKQFCDSLTSHLYLVSKDKHIGVSYNEKTANKLRMTENSEANEVNEKKFLNIVKQYNFGFEEVKIMKENVGYIKLTGFSPTRFAGETATSVMQFVSNTEALIFDLRVNFGGEASMIQLLTSYLFSSEVVHLNNFYHRKTNETTQSWTLPYVNGKRMPDIPVFILASNNTISAGEEFIYNLKQLKRATIIGEKTAGAANFGEEFIATGNVVVWIPTGRAINPITNDNWEGRGIIPDIETKADDALNIAYKMAIEKLTE